MPTNRKTRKPKTQNEHLWCIVNIRGLTSIERTVAFVLHALCFIRDGHERNAAALFLAKQCEISERSVHSAVKKIVDLGLYDRVDNKKGGRKGETAVYRPALPAWWREKIDPGPEIPLHKQVEARMKADEQARLQAILDHQRGR